MQTKRFLRLIDVELSSCTEDLGDLEELLKSRFETMEITHYVYMENDALLKREISGINHIRDRVLQIDPTVYTDADGLAGAVRATASDVIQEYQLPGAVLALVERKIEAVRHYLSSTV